MNYSSILRVIRASSAYIFLYVLSFGVIGSLFFPPRSPHGNIPWIEHIIIFLSFIYLARYFIYTMVSPWYDARWEVWRAKNEQKIKEYKPKVSVIIPEWNEEVGLISTVKSVLRSTYENLEIVVINDGSTDRSDNVMQVFLEHRELYKHEIGKTLQYYYKENGGKGSALNKGIELASGDIIITIDADCIVHKDAIQNFVAHFVDPSVMAAVGNVKIENTSSFLGTLQYLEFLFSFYFKRADSVLGSIYIIGGAAGAFRKEVFEKIGYYSQGNITEDIELTIRIQKAGLKIVYAADAIVYTEGANDIQGLLKQRLRWKRGRIDAFVQYKDLFFSRKRTHNKVLTWLVLPFAVLGDTELLFEIPFILFLYITALTTGDYSPFIAALLIVTLVFYVQNFALDSKFNKKNVYLLAPIGWLMFYSITIVELIALLRSLWSIVRKRQIKWQSWKRAGIK